MEAKLTNYRQSPRKVRLLADLVRGKSYPQAVTILSHTQKRAVEPFLKVLKSAGANAVHNHGADVNNLIVKDVQVDKGIVLKRSMPRARGSASRINKRTSHILIKLVDSTTKLESKIEVKAEAAESKVAKKTGGRAPKVKATKTTKKAK